MNRKIVIVDPLVNIQYASFYILGLYELYGRDRVVFDPLPFNCLPIQSRYTVLNFILKSDEKNVRKVSINLNDPYDILEENYKWCDVYGNVNANFRLTPEKYHEKLVSLSPSFGIKIWNFKESVRFAFDNLIKVSNLDTNKKKFVGKYKKTYFERLPYSSYIPKSTNEEKYVFHASTLWYNDEWNRNDVGVNLRRAEFIRVCNDLKGTINFEGGLIPQNKNRSSVDVFSDVLYLNNIKINDYISKIQKSVLVFNTPAFWNCHGWKLGEFLALGKAIISTPLSNDLPYPLVHGENIHFISSASKNEIQGAILTIVNDVDYRRKLENGARKYWETYGSPVESLKLLGIN